MPETRTYQGHTYQRNGPGEPWVRVPEGGRSVILRDPYREAEEARKEEDQEIQRQRVEMERERVRIAQQNAARSAATEERKTRFTPGQQKADEEFAKDYAEWNAAGGYAQLESQLSVLESALEALEGEGQISGPLFGRLPKFMQQIINPQSQDVRADVERSIQASLRQTLGAQFTQKEGEDLLARTFDPTQAETSNARRLRNLINEMRAQGRAKEEAGRYFEEHGTLVGWTPPTSGSALDRIRIGNTAPQETAGFGATEGQTVTVPPEMNAEHDALVARLLQQGGNRIDPDAYAQGMAEIVSRYPQFQASPDAWASWATEMNAYLDAGGKTIPSGVQIEGRPLTDVEWLRNSLVDNPVGSFAASVGNAGGFGIPGLLAGDQMDALRESRPFSSFAGEVGGGLTGTALAGKLLGMGAGRVGNSVVADLIANPMTADMAYGGVYGATQADDPLTGLVAGTAASFAGNKAGRWIGEKMPILTGVRRPEDALGRGERAVFDAANNTGIDEVTQALVEGQNLGVPVSLADASPDVNTLTGAAIRRSPGAADLARGVLIPRQRGQYDRLLGAIERDLGPIENIPQRSEDLITQARTAARPLYEAAYQAPGAEKVDLSDLADRPTFGAALREAYQEVLDEGLDPSAVGLQEAGDGIMIASPSWQTLDYVKRGLDNIIERNTTKIDGITPEGRRAVAMKNMLLERMDELNPDYAAARAAYASPAAEREALRRGQEALRMSPNQLGVNMGNASEAQRGQMQLGFQSALAEQAGRLRNNSNPFGLLDTPAMEQRLAAMAYQDEDIARLLAQRDLEGQLAGSANRLIGNSMTAERGIADEAFAAQSGVMDDAAPMLVETAISGAPWATGLRSVASRLGGQGLRDWRTLGMGRRATELADEIAPISLETNPAVAEEMLYEMVERDALYRAVLEDVLGRAAVRGGHGGAALGAATSAGLTR